MVDVIDQLLKHLQANAALMTATDGNIWGGRLFPPDYWNPNTTAIVFTPRGGTPDGDTLLRESFTFKCYAPDDRAAWDLYRLLVGALHKKRSRQIRSALLEVTGTLQTEQDPLTWLFVLCFFSLQFNFGEGE